MRLISVQIRPIKPRIDFLLAESLQLAQDFLKFRLDRSKLSHIVMFNSSLLLYYREVRCLHRRCLSAKILVHLVARVPTFMMSLICGYLLHCWDLK